MRMKTLMVIAALAAFALAVPTAEAAITPTLIAVTPNGDGTFTYTYNVDLAEDQNAMNDGVFPTGATTPTGPGDPSSAFQDYFTIFDFAGLVAGSWTQPEGWTFALNFVGPNGTTATPSDDPGLLNIYWVRTGEDLAGPQDLGNFSVRSAFGLVALDNYTSDATRSQGRNGRDGRGQHRQRERPAGRRRDSVRSRQRAGYVDAAGQRAAGPRALPPEEELTALISGSTREGARKGAPFFVTQDLTVPLRPPPGTSRAGASSSACNVFSTHA